MSKLEEDTLGCVKRTRQTTTCIRQLSLVIIFNTRRSLTRAARARGAVVNKACHAPVVARVRGQEFIMTRDAKIQRAPPAANVVYIIGGHRVDWTGAGRVQVPTGARTADRPPVHATLREFHRTGSSMVQKSEGLTSYTHGHV